MLGHSHHLSDGREQGTSASIVAGEYPTSDKDSDGRKLHLHRVAEKSREPHHC
jgi:hypothetical protein